MKTKLIAVLNHEMTDDQTRDAYKSLRVNEIENIPVELKALWANIPPDEPYIAHHLAKIREWLFATASTGDYVLVQGDFGACFIIATFAIHEGLIPVYSTTSRVAEEAAQPDGSVALRHVFRHVMFRKYGE